MKILPAHILPYGLRITLSVMLLWMVFPLTLTAGCTDKANEGAKSAELNEYQQQMPASLLHPLADAPLCEDQEKSTANLVCSLIPAADTTCLTQDKAIVQADRLTFGPTDSLLATGEEASDLSQQSASPAYDTQGFSPQKQHAHRLLRAPPVFS